MNHIFCFMGKFGVGYDVMCKLAYEYFDGRFPMVMKTEEDLAIFDLEQHSYLYICDLSEFRWQRIHYPEGAVVPLYFEKSDYLRLSYALDQECMSDSPDYKKVCGRYLEDELRYAESKLEKAWISERYDTRDFDICMDQVVDRISDLCGIFKSDRM